MGSLHRVPISAHQGLWEHRNHAQSGHTDRTPLPNLGSSSLSTLAQSHPLHTLNKMKTVHGFVAFTVLVKHQLHRGPV